MDDITHGLIIALKALPKQEKENAIAQLLEDRDYKQFAAVFLVDIFNKNLGVVQKMNTFRERRTARYGQGDIYNQLHNNYVHELIKNGIIVSQYGKVWAKTNSGMWVAMPLATERHPDRWFLGLSETEVIKKNNAGGVTIILLCQSDEGSLLDFVIPASKVKELLPKLSKSKDQLKFNLKKERLHYYLTLPDTQPMDITEFQGRWSILK